MKEKDMKQGLRVGMKVGADLLKDRVRAKMKMGSIWTLEHYKNGELYSKESVHNIVPDEFIEYVISVSLDGGTAYSTWYIGLASASWTPATGDTYATPAFTEASSYTGDRKTWSKTQSGVSITNSSSKASFTMNGNDSTIYGCHLTNVATPADTAAANGILGPTAKFASAKTDIENTDVLKVYVTLTGADDGV
jgi:hypothetical protein